MATSGGVKNRGVLFAHVYVDSVINTLKQTDGSALLETVKEWFDKVDRSSLEQYVSSLVGPMLDVQGFVRGDLKDHIISLFEDRNRTKMLSLCYVVDSMESLDQISKGKNYAIYLIKELKQAGLRWGILTNGNSWRLYYTKEKALFETYFQIDLLQAIKDKDSMEVALFAHFFNVQVFYSKEEPSICPIDILREESDEATAEIEKHLQTKMEGILSKICLGFMKAEGKEVYSEEETQTIFNNSIYLLYRLLFILYAEARGFLPVKNPHYHEKSISEIMKIVKEYHCSGAADSNGKSLWNTLSEVSNWINQGNHALGIPPYNGGLFDNDKKPYLANHSISDSFLSEALFNLGYREKKDQILPINYDDLSVRHLGSLYEGLLEYQLFIAPERMVRRKDGSTYKFVPERFAGKITRQDLVIEKGDVYFSQSNGERKLTGSYYTPEYIVQYIVEKAFEERLERINRELKSQVDKTIEASNVAINDEERQKIQRYGDLQIVSLMKKEALSVKILDPAMGSGHFLVNAAYHLSNYIVESLSSTKWVNDSINSSSLWWRRQIVEKCLYGVDINELATELTKLSLWLTTADNEKPLTFLDHHIKTGNSLIGTRLEQLGNLPKNGKINSNDFQSSLSYFNFKRQFVPYILELLDEMNFSSEHLSDVEKKKEKLEEWQIRKKNLQYVADIWVSAFFGHEIDDGNYQSLLKLSLEKKIVQLDDAAQRIAEAKGNQFFHWWLEYPDVFLNSFQNTSGGFDIVIGNPPYVRIQGMHPSHIRFFSGFYEAATRNYDIYALFAEKGYSLLNEKGQLGFILPSKFINADYGEGLRRVISKSKSLDTLVDLKDFQVFEGASTYTCLLFLNRRKNADFTYLEINDNQNAFNNKSKANAFKNSKQLMPSDTTPWVFISNEFATIVRKIEQAEFRLGDIAQNIFQGLITGADKLYFVRKINEFGELTTIRNSYDSREFAIETRILRKLLRGKEIQRWQVDWESNFIVYPYFVHDNTARLITIDELQSQFPYAYKYFLNYESLLKLREKGRFLNEKNWHQFGRLQNIEKFEQPKIMTQVLSSRNSFTFDETDNYYFVGGGNAGGYGILLKPIYFKDYYWVLCLLNSKLLEFYLKRISTPFQGGFFSYGKRFIEQLPIIEPEKRDKTELSRLGKKMLELGKQNSHESSANSQSEITKETTALEQEMNDLTYEVYGINDSSRKVIESALKKEKRLS